VRSGYFLIGFYPHMQTSDRMNTAAASKENKDTARNNRSIKGGGGSRPARYCKVPGNDYVEGGITSEESIAICKILEELGVSALVYQEGVPKPPYHT